MKKRSLKRRALTAFAICSLILSLIAFGFGGTGRVAAKSSSVSAAKAFQADASGTHLNYSVKGKTKPTAKSKTPFGRHGKLSVGYVKGFKQPVILDKHKKFVQLRGVSTHGIQWFPQYVNKAAMRSLRDEWGINTVRLAVYPREGGYLQGSQDQMDAKIKTAVKAARKLGMYVIIDWHVLNYNPNDDLDQAQRFFKTYAAKYKNDGHVIFEICNEPTNTKWFDGSGRDLYTYCKTVSKTIRDSGSGAIILCGTNTWSQDIDEVAKKPLDVKNVMYTVHFYAGTHREDLQNKLKQAIDSKTPIFASEFGICDASGNGGYDIDNANRWMTLLTNNGISFTCWSLCNKDESASCLKPTCDKTSKWQASDLNTTGIWLINTCRKLSQIM
jgi:endoglucanase